MLLNVLPCIGQPPQQRNIWCQMIAVLRSPKLSPFSWRERPRMSPELEKGRDGQEKRGSLSRAPSSLPGRLMILWAHPQVDGILEDWIWEMVAALKSQLAQPVNVGLAEWVTLAHNHYTTAVRNTRLVGQEIAALLQWLQVRPAPTSLLSSPFPSLPPRLSELGWSPTAAKTGRHFRSAHRNRKAQDRDQTPGLSRVPPRSPVL